eukprot:CAMPEP_0176236132 /NCGR_PEP_ID=MMETSP0121_2-20121125/27188_1 /TAXON_ID=160619 /ORGANISM="Kryptoperidinium foliaceum, Strain CCMP 1326" /LENGTH=51 /DNA_ID=CAMNT_0017575559 /DNA_START=90 /DNA_END=245 /DNA_ORIENTATION=+
MGQRPTKASRRSQGAACHVESAPHDRGWGLPGSARSPAAPGFEAARSITTR